ncbi:MAG TPA: riboflavin synthase [Deltaproteobacteria bacterium]|nr:MAG: riboflavin synthase subunit alpha [Pseudomonadota bacterium]HBM53134.1 riboflavin synthase [Deltaproteobacteria bacterium]
MFTGIVQGKGEILFSKQVSGGLKLRIQMNEWSTCLELGASVAVSGVCLTVVNFQEGEWAEFDVIQETLDRSNLGMLQVGSPTNIERSLKMGDELGGHQVNGHVDCKAQILQIEQSPGNHKIWIEIAPHWNRYLVPKGWIAVDGISLTVVDVEPDRFSVCLIPETLSRTTLGNATQTTLLNLEFDHQTKVIVESVERLLPKFLEKVT